MAASVRGRKGRDHKHRQLHCGFDARPFRDASSRFHFAKLALSRQASRILCRATTFHIVKMSRQVIDLQENNF
jgi:hypothetical protein